MRAPIPVVSQNSAWHAKIYRLNHIGTSRLYIYLTTLTEAFLPCSKNHSIKRVSMARRLHPFQKLCYVSGTSERPHVVVAAAGPMIAVFDLSQYKLLSMSSPFHAQLVDDGVDAEDSANGPNSPKRRKLGQSSIAPVSREASDESIEIISERRKGERKKPKVEDSKLPSVSHLLATSEGKTILAVTTEDKSINVLSLENSGNLLLRSRR